MGKDKKAKRIPNFNTGKPVKDFFRKLWYFIWEDDSIWSWVVNIALAFLIIKFLVYPGLGFVLGTDHPVVAVVSGSMEHDGSFDDWWDSNCAGKLQSEIYDSHGISKEEFREFKLKNGFNKGDMIILSSKNNVEVGDTIVFMTSSRADPIIHRVVEITDKGYMTKGDHNCGTGDFEKEIPESNVIGKAALRVPFLGWIKLGFMGLLNIAR